MEAQHLLLSGASGVYRCRPLWIYSSAQGFPDTGNGNWNHNLPGSIELSYKLLSKIVFFLCLGPIKTDIIAIWKQFPFFPLVHLSWLYGPLTILASWQFGCGQGFLSASVTHITNYGLGVTLNQFKLITPVFDPLVGCLKDLYYVVLYRKRCFLLGFCSVEQAILL